MFVRGSSRVRCACRFLLLSGLAFFLVQIAFAQTPAPIQKPESVVLVLKLVSATHVRPTTGVVISSDGLVIVPAEFVSAGDEIVVMDGGTDILSHARPARTVKRSATDGLAVLSVEGLEKPAMQLSQKAFEPEEIIHLSAFPPADKLAEGAEPLWMPVKLLRSDPVSGLSISSETPLPNVSGAMIDNCGQLVGLNLASGEQSLDTDKGPILLIGDRLTDVFDSMQIAWTPGSCSSFNTQEHPLPSAKPVIEDSSENSAGIETDEVTPGPLEDHSSAAEELSDNPDQTNTGLVAQSIALPGAEAKKDPRSLISIIPWWLWIAGLLILIALLVKVIMFLRATGKSAQQPVSNNYSGSGPVASTEPDTAQLQAGSSSFPLNPGVEESQLPDLDDLPDGYDSIVLLEGYLGDNTSFRRFCVVNAGKIDIVIGRGDAEICIETQSISRKHIRVEGDGVSLTVSDLGSSNGTYIREIPCLSGEIMFIEPGDEILLGDVRFRIRMLTGAAEVS